MTAQEFYEKYKGKYFTYDGEKVRLVGFERDSDFIIISGYGEKSSFLKNRSYFISKEYASISDVFHRCSIYEKPFCQFVNSDETEIQPCAESISEPISKRLHAACCAMNGIVSGLMQSEEWHGWDEKYIAERAYLLADELLKQGGFTE